MLQLGFELTKETLTQEIIKQLVLSHLDDLAADCGEIGPGQSHHAEWLGYGSIDGELRLLMGATYEFRGSGYSRLVAYDCGITTDEIEDELASRGIQASEGDNDWHQVQDELFNKKWVEHLGHICVAGAGPGGESETYWVDDEDVWANAIIEVLQGELESLEDYSVNDDEGHANTIIEEVQWEVNAMVD